jgi:hypothetical protein
MFEDTFSKIVRFVNHEVMGNGGCYRIRHLVISIAVTVLSQSQVKGHAAHIGWIRNAYRILVREPLGKHFCRRPSWI